MTLELYTLGGADLRTPEGASLRAILQQPKRLALLVYLATATPGRPVRRDLLLARFWPDLDQEHARSALRRALYFLRQACGAEVLVGAGDEEVGVDPDRLWCDALGFDQAIDGNDLTQALELYRGHFLDGFYVQGAPEAEAWFDRERSRRRYEAALAAWQLARQPAADPAATRRWALKAIDLAPADQDAVLAHVLELERRGDRGLALHLLRHHREVLATELEAVPSPDLAAAAARIAGQGSVDRPLAYDDDRRLTTTGLPPSREVGSAADSTLVAVCPFVVRGDPAVQYLAEGVVDLLSTKLDGTGALRAADPKSVLRLAGPAAATGVDLETAQRIAAEVGAGLFVVGTMLESRGRIEAGVGLYRADGKLLSRAEARAEGDGAVFELIDEVVRRLVADLDQSAAGRLGRLAALTTHSVPALKAYLQGEREFRLGRHLQALALFQRATHDDPSFALAYYRLASSLAASALIGPALLASAEAYRHRERLSDHDRLLLEAQHHWLRGRTGEAERRYAALTTTFPEQVEPWFLLGDLLFHSNPYRGRPIGQAREPFERAVALEPGHIGALVQLARLAAADGRLDDLGRLVDRALALSPAADQALGLRALRAFALGDPAMERAVLEELPRAQGLTMARAFADVALYAGNLEGALGLGEAVLPAARSAEFLALGNIVMAHLDVARGRPAVGMSRLRLARRHEPAWGLETLGLWAAAPFDLMTAEERAEVTRDLEAWDPAGTPAGVAVPLVFHDGLHAHFREFLLGLLAVRRGDLVRGRAAAAAWSELPVPPGAEILAEQLARTLDAVILRAEGHPAEALAVLERVKSDVWFQTAVGSPFFAGAYQRFLRAELLEETGRAAEAVAWWNTMAQRSPYELVFAGPARERAAAAARRLTSTG